MAATRFLQTKFWASFKGAHGWTPLYFVRTADGSVKPTDQDSDLCVLVRTFRILVKKFSLAYIPMAPEFASDTDREAYVKLLEDTAAQLKPYLPGNTLFVRFDPPADFTTMDESNLCKKDFILLSSGKKGLCKSFVDIQPPDTVLLSLDKDEDSLLAEMRSKWRYNIRLASKKGVQVSSCTADSPDFEQNFNRFYELFEQTSKRDGVSFHNRDYYIDLLRRSARDHQEDPGAPLVQLYLARHEEDYLAGIITLFCAREAVYLYGASGNIKRNLMPAYLLQWTAIQDAKKYGCPVYDFYGMPPTDDENHPMHGLYLFKTGFGGTIIHRPGSFDVPLKETYGLYVAAERFRAWWHKKVLKKIAGR